MQNIVEQQNEVGISTRISQQIARRLAIVAAEQGRSIAGQVRFLVTQAMCEKRQLETR